MLKKELTISDILHAFEIFDGVYKHCEVDEAIKRKEEITPHLLNILESVHSNPGYYAQEENNFFAHKYAVMLLAHFKETSAHDTIIKLFKLPGELPFDLFGDTTTEELRYILYSTSGGNWKGIKSMILDTNINEYCRSAALEALVFFVAFGYIPRDEIIQFLDSLFLVLYEENSGSDLLLTTFARVAHDIYPEALIHHLDKAYEEGMIASFFICREDFESALKQGKEKTLEETRAELERRFPKDFHDKMSWWACFNSNNRYTSSGQKIPHTTTEKNKKKRTRKGKKRKKK
jgi:hypothetical protein